MWHHLADLLVPDHVSSSALEPFNLPWPFGLVNTAPCSIVIRLAVWSFQLMTIFALFWNSDLHASCRREPFIIPSNSLEASSGDSFTEKIPDNMAMAVKLEPQHRLG